MYISTQSDRQRCPPYGWEDQMKWVSIVNDIKYEVKKLEMENRWRGNTKRSGQTQNDFCIVPRCVFQYHYHTKTWLRNRFMGPNSIQTHSFAAETIDILQSRRVCLCIIIILYTWLCSANAIHSICRSIENYIYYIYDIYDIQEQQTHKQMHIHGQVRNIEYT